MKERRNLNELLDSLPIAIQTFDQNGIINYANKKYEELFKCPRENIYGLTLADIDKKFNFDGNKTYFSLHGDKLNLVKNTFSSNNKTSVFYDEIKKQQELDNLHIQTETILSAVNNGIIMIDTNMNVIICNESAERTLETKNSDVVGLNIFSFFKRFSIVLDDPKEINKLRNIKEKEVLKLSVLVNEKRKELLIYITIIKNVEESIIGYLLVSTDITQIKKDSDKLMHHENLALLGQLGASIVHETRNYLSTIKGKGQIIYTISNDLRVKRHANSLITDIDEVNNIISEFLHLSKPKKPTYKERRIIDVFNSIKQMIISTSLVRGIKIDINITAEDKYVYCDDNLIKQVILNICKNAVEVISANPDPKIVIDAGYLESSDEFFIKITDNGCGISDDILDKIGTPFFTTKENGTGLGLSISYKIIQEHNGHIDVLSEVGKGSSFIIYLPCYNGANACSGGSNACNVGSNTFINS